MPKFAHMSDIHIGAFRQPELKRLLLDAFDMAIDRCIAERVDFVIISGDIFDSNIPDLAAVGWATRKIKEARDLGIRFYAVYGSHDFSPNYASIVDVLESAGIFLKVERPSGGERNLRLELVEDPTGAKICGISGKKLSLDRSDYEILDRGALERVPGFKIFVFHGALDELKPPSLSQMEAMPSSYLPAGFDYYAGGHVHEHAVKSLQDRRNIVYPGPVFATDYSELVPLAHGEERGFYLVDFDEAGVNKISFEAISVCDVVEIFYSAEGKTAAQASKELSSLASGSQVDGRVALLTVEGQLSEGKTSDIDFFSIKKRILASGPLSLLANYSKLSSKEQARQVGPSKPFHVTERELFLQNIARVKSGEKKLLGEEGVKTSLELLGAMKQDRKENENKSDFQERTERAGLQVLGLKDDV
jgi:DNA repair protein SbcD/Mre11